MSFRCEHLSKSFALRDGVVQAIDDITFSVREGEFVSIVGPSGCGKTTLLKLITGLLQPTSGSVVRSAAGGDGRPAAALVFQEHGLFPWMTVLENVAFGLETRGVPREKRHERALAFIASVGLAPFAGAYPHQLSVGMRQRVGIARAFVTDPQLLLMDEPLGSLDAQTRLLLQEELLRLWTRSKSSVVYVTHDIEEAVLLGDRVLVLTGRPGRIQGEITVPLGRPRRLEYATNPEVGAIKWQVWKMLEQDARRSLSMSAPGAAPPEAEAAS
ncbi:MAG TPA: ABC transporter ATP-binding protein [Thermoanaerobaculia bacterium]|nr:ABC transporter ATP-binding protein [Thermoanaerobaculia bacterium]